MNIRLFSVFLLLGLLTKVSAQIPTLNCPSDTTYYNSINCSATASYSITCDANCIGTTITQTDLSGFSSGDDFPFGYTYQEYTISNGSDSSTCSFYIIVVDTISPLIICPSDQTQYVDNNCETIMLDYKPLATTSDNCDSLIIKQSPVPGVVLSGTSSQTVTLIATDSSGNSSTCSFQLNLLDTIAPNITCLGTQNVSANANCEAILGDYTALMNVNDNCDPNPIVTQNPAIGTTIMTSQIVTMYATDNSGNLDSCTFLVIVDDNLPPSITCPPDSNVYTNANCEYSLADLTGYISVSDNCDPNLTIAQHPAIGTIFNGGDNPFISFNVTDLTGNASVCSYRILVVDTIPPSITCPGSQTEYVNANCQFVLTDYTGLSASSDNCSGSILIEQSPIPGTVMNGNTNSTITITATDIIGNFSTCQFNLVSLDTIPPIIIDCAPDTIKKADTNCVYIVEDYSNLITVSDNCQSSFVFSQNPAIGSSLNVGTSTQITVFAADSTGNSDSCSFMITVADLTAPTFDCPQNPNVPLDTNCAYIIPDYEQLLAPSDNCDPSFIFTQSISVADTLYGIGTQQTIALTATDIYNNINSCTFTITLTDTTSPTITCPGNQTIDLDLNCLYVVPDLIPQTITSDHCDPFPLITQSIPPGSTTGGINVLYLTSTDASGNSNTCAVNLYPNDTVPPVIACSDSIFSCDPLVSYSNPNGSDDCSLVTITQTDSTGLSSGSNFPTGISTLTYTAEDEMGNTASCNVYIEIYEPVNVDAGSDVIIEEGESTTLNATVTNGINLTWSPNFNMDNPYTEDPTVDPTFSTTYYLEAESIDGCTGIDSVIVFVTQVNELIINNIITPNGDGKNDTWDINKPSVLSGCPVSIFNRWGKLVWQSNSYNNQWDGTNNEGEPLPDGNYFYTIICNGNDFNGTVILMR